MTLTNLPHSRKAIDSIKGSSCYGYLRQNVYNAFSTVQDHGFMSFLKTKATTSPNFYLMVGPVLMS